MIMKNVIFNILIFTVMLCSEIKPQSIIKYGSATLEGKVSGTVPDDLDKSVLYLQISNICLSDRLEYVIPINKEGYFSYEIPITSGVFGAIESDIYNGGIFLVPDEKTILNIHFKENGEKDIEIINKEGYTVNDMINMVSFTKNILLEQKFMPDSISIMTPQKFSEYSIKRINLILDTVDSETKLSPQIKKIIKKELSLFYLNNTLLDYVAFFRISQSKDNDKEKIVEPDMSYYNFLKKFNLNDTLNLSCTYYPIVLQTILNNKTFNIDPIGDEDIETWITNVKNKLENVLGFNDGVFYDLSICNTFAAQLNDMRPLTDKQVANIKHYFKNEAIAEILIAENHRILNLIAEDKNSKQELIIKKKKVLEKSSLVKDIINKHSGKAIIVDFWATWCSPCVKAIREMETLKKEYENKDIVFVYISSYSSPQKTWEIMKKDIPGDHYYVDEKTWDQLSFEFEFGHIPTYLFIDKSGNVLSKYVSFMGVDKTKELIDKMIE